MENVRIVYLLLVNFIIITYPILINTIFLAYKKIINDKAKSIILDINILISFYLILKVNTIFNQDYAYIVFYIPLLIAFIYKKKFVTFLLTICIFEISYEMINPLLLATQLLSFHLLFFIQEKRKKDFPNIFFLNTFIFVVLDFLLFEKKDIFYITNLIILFIIIYIIIKIIVLLLSKSSELLNTFLTFKDLEKEKQIRTSLFKITHEIKNPIAVIKGYLDMFDYNKENSINYIDIMKSEVDRTLKILNDFSGLKNMRIHKDIMDCSLLIEDIKFLMIPYFNNHDIMHEFIYKNELLIKGDYEKIKQVIINIIKNSVESFENRNNKKIIFKNYIIDKYAVFFIRDNGKGMDNETYNNLFSHFFTTKENGTGLGLVLSKEIVEAHNGKIIINTKKNKGTTTYIYIPIN